MLHMKSTNGLVESAVLFMVNRHRQLHVYGYPTTVTPTTPTIDPDVAREIREPLPNDIDEITIDVNGNRVTNRPILVTPIPVTFTTQGDEFLNDLQREIIDGTFGDVAEIAVDDVIDDADEDEIDDEDEQLIDRLEEVFEPVIDEGEDTDIEVIDLTQPNLGIQPVLPPPTQTILDYAPPPTWVLPDLAFLRNGSPEEIAHFVTHSPLERRS